MNYSFENGGITNAEIKAYSSAVVLVNEKMDDIFSNIFVQSALSSGLTKYEIMLSINNLSSDISLRRQEIIKRLSEKYGYFSLNDLKQRIEQLGENLTFSQSNGTLSISGFNSNDEEKIRAMNLIINSYIPCFLDSSLGNNALTFNDWNSMNITFFDLDKLKFRFDNVETWKGLDNE